MSTIYLLSIRGVLAPKTLEAARQVHNQTAGAPPNVAAAQSLGDMSHMVYVPMEHDSHHGNEFLILDQWNNLDGLNQFFANPQVQQQAGQIFSQRDPVVWMPAEGFTSYHSPAPFGRNDRIVGVVRGPIRSVDAARAAHNAIVEKSMNKARMRGDMSHEAYLRLAPPGSPEALEFFAVDVWYNPAGMGEQYEDPEFLAGFEQLFAGEPSASVWTHPAGDWVEW
jgi:quinol monooxygenase YgiN